MSDMSDMSGMSDMSNVSDVSDMSDVGGISGMSGMSGMSDMGGMIYMRDMSHTWKSLVEEVCVYNYLFYSRPLWFSSRRRWFYAGPYTLLSRRTKFGLSNMVCVI